MNDEQSKPMTVADLRALLVGKPDDMLVDVYAQYTDEDEDSQVTVEASLTMSWDSEGGSLVLFGDSDK